MIAGNDLLFQLIKGVLEEDRCPVVLCDTEHKIVYMNPAACTRYQKYGGEDLLGKSLLACHNAHSAAMIQKILEWFGSDVTHNRVHTFYNEKENKDGYMIALRGTQGELIGYYEKHEYRDQDPEPFYQMD